MALPHAVVVGCIPCTRAGKRARTAFRAAGGAPASGGDWGGVVCQAVSVACHTSYHEDPSHSAER
jgi:hypothetical protein